MPMASERAVGILRHLIHQRLFIPGRVADKLQHYLVITRFYSMRFRLLA